MVRQSSLGLMAGLFIGALLAVTMLGCSGGSGGGGANPYGTAIGATPEETLRSQLAAWRVGPAPNLTIAGLVSASSTTRVSLGTISLRDMSGGLWEFTIRSITYRGSLEADVLTTFVFDKTSATEVEVLFSMVRSYERWLIDDIQTAELPEILVTPGGTGTSTGTSTSTDVSTGTATGASTGTATGTSPTPGFGTLRGLVTDQGTGQPIADALVSLAGTSFTAKTDATGVYEFTSIPVGTYNLVVTRDGFVIKTLTVRVV